MAESSIFVFYSNPYHRLEELDELTLDAFRRK